MKCLLRSDIPPTGMWWSRAVLHKVIMTLVILWVTLTFRHSLTPLTKIEKNINFNREKVFKKSLNMYMYMFLGMLIEMHYVRTCVTSSFWVIMVFLDFFPGRSKCRVLKNGVGVKMGPKDNCCIGPILYSWFWAPFYAMCLPKLWFFRNHIS